ncbi:unnamed protein product [Arabidopsis lyrata]|uniref:Predicted protein n=1 Tax=Arabidopsis lyrata subsp. lyrata TaxID=81972 RepID=D7KYA4_ARALL|nr:predicted protein [Arabidopsis lyrata subsp. lyrata]CAH8256545.1 unnamed protein product [Arabidopsis lyrata]
MEAKVTVTDRTDDDECLILASDGLWNVVPNETALWYNVVLCPRGAGRADCDDSVAAAVDNACSDASLLLTKFALARPSFDNVSVVVQWLTGGRGGIINHRLNN